MMENTIHPDCLHPKKDDWLAGWEASPIGGAATYSSFKTADQAHHFEKRRTSAATNLAAKGFRASYLDHAARHCEHVPGPGNYRTQREFPLYDSGDQVYRGTMNSGRLADSAYQTMSKSKRLKNSSQAHHIREGLDVDLKYTTNHRFCSPQIQKTPNLRSCSSLKDAKRSQLPTSFWTPGPGAYTAYTSFGAASGGSRKRFLGTRKHDNNGMRRLPEKSGEDRITAATASSTVLADAADATIRLSKSQGTLKLSI